MKYIHKEMIVKKSEPIELPDGCIGVTLVNLYEMGTGTRSEKIRVEYLEPCNEFKNRNLWEEEDDDCLIGF